MVDSIKTSAHDAIVLSSSGEKEAQARFAELLRNSPLPSDELLPNLGLYLTSKNLSRVLFFYEIYRKILETHGVIIEFGVRWGQTLSLLSALRGIFEPFNRHRKIIGFDTFAGFKGLSETDGAACKCADGSFSVPAGYQGYLERLLALQEELNPLGHLRKFELVAGDATQTVPAYL
ncbi:MAG: crotonobetainyl-CoA--carnitine CoA-transferase, partial [Planctomycetes bacterium]|nr:crotonobetainyl-CoA--carnitine CoA-transferase [Planctomycetota bacterium]